MYLAVLIALVALLGCGDDDATEVPAKVPVAKTEAQTADAQAESRPEPTFSAESSAAQGHATTPESTATMHEPQRVTCTGTIRHLRLDDPLAIISGLSTPELTCFSRVTDIDRVSQILSTPGLATPEEDDQLISCLQDETLLRMFLGDLIPASGELSADTSGCVRAQMTEFDLRSVTLAQREGGEALISLADSSAFVRAMTCLNEEEWQAAAPAVGWGPEEEGMRCLVDKIGGPKAFAEILASEDESEASNLIGAAIVCEAEMLRGEVRAVSSPTGEPVPGPRPTADGVPAAGSEIIAPLDLNSPEALASELSDSELTCLAGVADVERLLEVIETPEFASPREQTQLADCLEEETLLRIFLLEVIQDYGPLSTESSGCIRTGMEGIDVGGVLLGGSTGDEESVTADSTTAVFLTMSCLNEKEWEALAPVFGMGAVSWEAMQCLSDQLGGPHETAQYHGGG